MQVSEYVRSVVARTPWEDRGSIQYLFELEKIARGQTRSWRWIYNAYVRPQRMKAHWTDYVSILNEVDPQWRERQLQAWQAEYETRRREYLETERRIARDALVEDAQQRELWARTGQRVTDRLRVRDELSSEEALERHFSSRGVRPPWTPNWMPGSPEARV